ncbi:flavodoxin family protein [Thalassospiraceae bacterium LMO-JJ14]|nr:flavodoxin family protein [Thalassospiraceae bacterium LMO-JJ14]
MSEKTLLIVGHVPSANTRALRDAVQAGAASDQVDGIDVRVLSPFDAGVADVLGADAVILGTTENLGYMSGALKDFFDRTYYGVLEEKQGLPYALYVRAGLDGTGTIRGVESITTGLRWKAVRAPLLLKGTWQDGFVDEAHELGLLVAAGLEAGVF